MFILENVPLSGYSTMRLGGTAAYLTEINKRNEIAGAVAWADERGLPVMMIGIGSNIVWKDEGFPGLVLVNKIERFETYKEDAENLYVTGGAGENWDSFVSRVVDMGYSGLEQLSLIPGTVGATPVQNVGAYGREIADVLTTIEAYDREADMLVTIPGSDCEFGYRTSRFKTTDKGRFFITAVTYHVTKQLPQPPFYESLRKYFADNNITMHTAKVVRDAVIAIRSSKLPNPELVANNGSFFANPIINRDLLSQILFDYPDLMYWEVDDLHVKVAAAWLLEHAGFKDYHDQETGMATWPKQPLVFVNENAPNTASLIAFRDKIVNTVERKFHIKLEQEPELLP
jgi:UDP-N-acetylmuramate dehydrogenase